MMRAIRAFVASEEQAPIAFVDLAPRFAHERNARVGELLPLLANLLALVVRERRKKLAEVTVTGVTPVELHAVARDQSDRLAFGGLRIVGEQHVQRREATRADLRQRGVEQGPA